MADIKPYSLKNNERYRERAYPESVCQTTNLRKDEQSVKILTNIVLPMFETGEQNSTTPLVTNACTQGL